MTYSAVLFHTASTCLESAIYLVALSVKILPF